MRRPQVALLGAPEVVEWVDLWAAYKASGGATAVPLCGAS